MINYDLACFLYDYMLTNRFSFIFYQGVLIARETCELVIADNQL